MAMALAMAMAAALAMALAMAAAAATVFAALIKPMDEDAALWCPVVISRLTSPPNINILPANERAADRDRTAHLRLIREKKTTMEIAATCISACDTR